MFKYLIMLTFCVMAQRIHGKSLFDYNINPEYDLVAEPSTSYSNFWPSSEFYVSPLTRYKHQARGRGRGQGKGKGKQRHQLPPHAFDLSDGYHYPDSSEEFSGEIYHAPHPHPHPHHPHGIPPGLAKKQGHPHGPPHGHPYGPPHEPPRRFPPPPVYDKDFINPWAVPVTTPKPFIVQLPPLTTPRPFIVQQPPITTPAIYVAPILTTRRPTIATTPAPPSSTSSNDELIYDIDVRFGRD
ncbi:splicing factor 3B subunit 4-like [Calliphora vicina]|uniref:splicing factor 3B subunit 4-like n=1 Tax=Calliphora vicina TaxID=7373 RepID=UPI00325AA739